jgi:hypothetical protein
MKVRILQLGSALAISLLMFLVFFTVVGLAAPDEESGRHEAIVSNDVAAVKAQDVTSIVTAVKARDFITITISGGGSGVLSRDGQLFLASGKVECPEEGTYDLRLVVFQQAPIGIAMGGASGDCSGAGSEWQEWQAKAVGTLQLREGEAQVCAVIVVHFDTGATTNRTCRTMSLVK